MLGRFLVVYVLLKRVRSWLCHLPPSASAAAVAVAVYAALPAAASSKDHFEA